MNMRFLMNSMLMLVLALSDSVCMVSCVAEDSPARQDDTARQYAPEVYAYLNTANEREALDEEAMLVYRDTLWRYEEKNKKVRLPKHFRTSLGELTATPINDHPLPEPDFVPSRKGLDVLSISGSGRFSLKELEVLTDTINQLAGDRPKVIIDLRGECHGFVNGSHMSLYGLNNWSNIGRQRAQIMAAEEEIFAGIKGTTITAYTISSDNAYEPVEPVEVMVAAEGTCTEKQAVEQAGWQYRRVTALDHAFPCDETIDQFLNVYRSLPENAWLHFHCHKGNGRTTTYMSFYDMLRNPDVPLKDILYRQAKLGGGNLYYSGDGPDELPWRIPLYIETSWLIPLLYDYVQDNRANSYQVSWTDWKRKVFRLF